MISLHSKEFTICLSNFMRRIKMIRKIPCVVSVYYNFDIIKKTLDFICQYQDMLNIMVVENYSIHTNSNIKPYMLELLNNEIITKYVLFEENISNNALELIFKNNLIDELDQHEFFILTDGDVVVTQNDFLSEQLRIMLNHPDIFVCAVSLHLDNLPIENYPNAISWIPPDINQFHDYYETLTRLHFI